MDDTATLITLEKIRTLKARYCRLLDTKDWAAFGALFVDDAMLDVRDDTGLPPIRGRAALIAQVRAAVDDARTAHQVHSPEILLDGEDAASAVWAMQDRVVWADGRSPIPDVASITGYGHYHESYRRTAGIWRIVALKLTRLHVDRHA